MHHLGEMMGASACIGRVGGLAVALGVGAAVATGQGVAWATPSDSNSSTSGSSNKSTPNSSESASTNSNPGSPAVPSSSATSPATDLSSSLSRLKPTSGTISTPAIATRIAKPGQAVTSGGALISQRVTDALNKVRSALTQIGR